MWHIVTLLHLVLESANQRKLPRERGVAGRYIGPLFHFASLVPSRPGLGVVIAFVLRGCSRFGTLVHQKLHALPSALFDRIPLYGFWEIQLGARTSTRVDGDDRSQLIEFAPATHHHPPPPVIASKSAVRPIAPQAAFSPKPYGGVRSNKADGRA